MINVSLNLRIIILLFNLYYISCDSTIDTTETDLKDLAGKGFFGSKGNKGYVFIKTNFGAGEKIIAYADINNDKYTDIITYKQDNQKFQFNSYIYDHNKYNFNKTQNLFTLETDLYNPVIKNVIVNSFIKSSSKADFLISISNENKEYQTYLFYKKEENDENYIKKTLPIKSNIVVADINSDRNMEIIYFSDGQRKIYYFQDSYEQEGNIKGFGEILSSIDKEGASNNIFLSEKISDVYGSAFVDLNGDCIADLILTHEESDKLYLEIYYRNNQNLYNLKHYNFPKGQYGAFVIGDFNRDSQLDILFPHLNESKVTIFYNKYVSNHEWDKNYCENRNTNFNNNNTFDFEKKDPKSYKTIELIANKNNTNNYTFYGNDTLIRIGDFGSTGIPGLLAIFETKINSNIKRSLKLFDLDKDTLSEINLQIDDYLEKEKQELQYATFFDFAEDGRLDLIIQCKDKIISIWNNNSPDKFFIKNKIVLKKGKFSTLEFGTSFRYVVTDNEGLRSDNVVAQMPQTSGMIIPLPFAYQGIGRSNNYIEHLYAISNTFDKVDKYNISYNNDSFTPIIPNTQLIITKGYDKSKVNWEIELVVTPTENLMILLLVIIIILFIILFVIGFLHYKEKNEDKEQDSDNFRAWFA